MPMLRAIVARPYCLRRAAILIVALAIALQAFFAGLAVAQSTGLAVSGLGPEMAFICHGQGLAAGDHDHGTAPDPVAVSHLCCFACFCGGAPATLTAAALMPHTARDRAVQTIPPHVVATPVGRRAVRDGPSQAPPTLA
jgi:hypothetical protein